MGVRVAHLPYRLTFRDRLYTLSDEEATDLRKQIGDQYSARRRAQEAAQEAAGEVWYTEAWHHGTLDEERHYSLQDAGNYLEGLLDYGTGYPEAIRCPDGSRITSEDLTDDWRGVVPKPV